MTAKGKDNSSLSQTRLLVNCLRDFVFFLSSLHVFLGPPIPALTSSWLVSKGPQTPSTSLFLLRRAVGPLQVTWAQAPDEVRPRTSFHDSSESQAHPVIMFFPNLLLALTSRHRSINLSLALLSRPSVHPGGPQGVCQAGCKLPG